MRFPISFTGASFKTALTAGAMALTVAGASLATTGPAEAFVRHGGGFHGGGFHGGGFHRFGGVGHAGLGGFHRFGYGYGRHFGRYGFRRGIVGYRTFGVRRFAYGVGFPYSVRHCAIGRHFVPGLGCRPNLVYGYPRYGFRTYGYGVRRIVRPVFGYHRAFAGYGHGFRHVGFGGFHGGFRHAGFGHGGFGHGGFGHGVHFRHR